MVESKSDFYDDNDCFRVENDPPLVQAEHLPIDCGGLEPISVSVVTIDGDDGDRLQEATSVVSSESFSMAAQQQEGGAETSEEAKESKAALKAGITAGVVGTILGGPLLGVVAGGAGAYYSKQEGAAGDVSRALGEIGAASYEKAKELNRKHHLVDKSKKAATSAVKKAKEMNQKHHLVDKSKEAAETAFYKAKRFDEKHHVIKKLKAFMLLCIKELLKIAEKVGGRLQDGNSTKQLVAQGNANAGPQLAASTY